MRTIIAIMSILISGQVLAVADSIGSYYVTADKLNVRLSPSSSGKITNSLWRGSRVDVMEVNAGWARISKYYDGAVENVPGKVARWVSAKLLSQKKPVAPAAKGPLEKALSGSNDYRKYKKTFMVAAQDLIDSGTCTLHDFEYYGGWARSSSYKPKPVYFMYCGGGKAKNRLYLNAATGAVFR